MANIQIYETENLLLEAVKKPHVTRTDGGHLKITPKEHLKDRTEMTPQLAKEYMRLTMIVGEAFEKAMANRGIPLMRVNYQDMGNWAYKEGKPPYFHLHIYGRAKNAVHQPYMESVYLPDRSTGFYDTFEPLNADDVAEIKYQIELVSQQQKYWKENWK